MSHGLTLMRKKKFKESQTTKTEPSEGEGRRARQGTDENKDLE